MRIESLEVGTLGVCCYLLSQPPSTDAIVVDPGGDADRIADCLLSEGLRAHTILLTHSHYDHIAGVDGLLAHFPDCRVLAHPVCAECAADPVRNLSSFIGDSSGVCASIEGLDDGAEVCVGGMTLRALHAPGHAPGHMVFHSVETGDLFSGDVLFAGSVGRTDFPGCDGHALMASLARVVLSLPDTTRVYPGHGPDTTIGEERATNPFLQ